MLSRSQTNARDSTASTDLPIALGAHHTLYYQCLETNEEYRSSVDEIMQWITSGPLLKRSDTYTNLSLAEPSRPATLAVPSASGIISTPVAGQAPINPPEPTPNSADVTCAPDETSKRVSMRNRKPRDFLTPKMKGKAYFVLKHKPRKQRVPISYLELS